MKCECEWFFISMLVVIDYQLIPGLSHLLPKDSWDWLHLPLRPLTIRGIDNRWLDGDFILIIYFPLDFGSPGRWKPVVSRGVCICVVCGGHSMMESSEGLWGWENAFQLGSNVRVWHVTNANHFYSVSSDCLFLQCLSDFFPPALFIGTIQQKKEPLHTVIKIFQWLHSVLMNNYIN